MSSVKYYNQNANDFYERTINLDVSKLYEKFFLYVPRKAKILDAGCGVGRDAKYFLNLKHDVIAFDASIEMSKIASQEIGKNVLNCTFQDLDFINEFDAIWSNASLLHVPFDELKNIIQKLHLALKKNGIFFASFKYGNSSRKIEERVFFDMNEDSILPYIKGYFQPLEVWKSTDTRSQTTTPRKAWLNALCKAI